MSGTASRRPAPVRVPWLLLPVLAAALFSPAPAPAQSAADREARQLLDNARLEFKDRNYAVAGLHYRNFLGRFANHKDAPAARYGLAVCLLEGPNRDYNGALEQLQVLANQKDLPEYAMVLYYLGQAQRGLGVKELAQGAARPQDADKHQAAARQRFEEAGRQFQAAAQALLAANEPPLEWAARARCDQAEMQLRLGQPREALATLAVFFTGKPPFDKSRSRSLALYYQGAAHFLLGEYLAAGRSLNHLARLTDPTFGLPARYLLGRVHHLADERAEAALHYEGVLTSYEDSKKAAVDTLKRPERLRKDPVEKARLEALLRDPVPEHVAQAAFYLGMLHYDSGRFSEAAARFGSFAKWSARAPFTTEAQLRLGLSQVQLKQLAEAVKALQPLAEKEPRLADLALLGLGRAQVGAADPNNAQAYQQALKMALTVFRRAAERAQELEPTDPDAARRRGEILLEIGDTQQLARLHKEAAATYEQILRDRLLPQRGAELLQRQAEALNLAGDYDASDKVCEQFQKAHPHSPLLPAVLFRRAENAHGRALAAARNPNLPDRAQELARLNDEAIRRYEVVMTRYPEFEYAPLARQAVGLALHRKGEYEKAREVLEKVPAADRNGELASVSYVLADCLIRLAPVKADDALAAGRLQEDLQGAIELLDGFVGAQPKGPQTPDALLKLGFCRQRLAALFAQPKERAQMLNNARATYDLLIKQFPNHEARPQAVLERAKCRVLAGDPGGAINDLRAFRNDPLKNARIAPMALLELATLLRSQNRSSPEAANILAECRKQHEQALRADPTRAAWVAALQYHHGVCLKESGKLTEARDLLEGVVKQFPEAPEAAEAALRGAQCLAELGVQKIEKARQRPMNRPEEMAVVSQLVEEGLQEVRSAVDRLKTQADLLKEKPAAAEVQAQLLIEAARDARLIADTEANAARANLKLPASSWGPAEPKARSLYQQMIEAAADLPLANEARLELSELLSARGEHETALKVLNEALDKEPPPELTERVRLQLGSCHAARGDTKAALAQFDAVLRNPKSPLAGQAHYRAGESFMQAGDWAAAAKRFTIFREQQPFRGMAGLADRALFRAGQAYAQLKQWDQSVQAFEKLQSRWGNSPWLAEGNYGLGWAYQNQKQYDNAVNAYNRATAQRGTELAARAQLQVGLSRLEQKRYGEALSALDAVWSRYTYPELTALAKVEAARAQVELKKRDQAEKLLEQVLRDQPRSPWAEVARLQQQALREGKRLQRPELLAKDSSLAPVVSRTVALPPLSQPRADRAPLDDPTTEVSRTAVLAAALPVRETLAPFLKLNLPDPFEFHLPLKLKTAGAEDPCLPLAAVVQPRP